MWDLFKKTIQAFLNHVTFFQKILQQFTVENKEIWYPEILIKVEDFTPLLSHKSSFSYNTRCIKEISQKFLCIHLLGLIWAVIMIYLLFVVHWQMFEYLQTRRMILPLCDLAAYLLMS